MATSRVAERSSRSHPSFWRSVARVADMSDAERSRGPSRPRSRSRSRSPKKGDGRASSPGRATSPGPQDGAPHGAPPARASRWGGKPGATAAAQELGGRATERGLAAAAAIRDQEEGPQWAATRQGAPGLPSAPPLGRDSGGADTSGNPPGKNDWSRVELGSAERNDKFARLMGMRKGGGGGGGPGAGAAAMDAGTEQRYERDMNRTYAEGAARRGGGGGRRGLGM